MALTHASDGTEESDESQEVTLLPGRAAKPRVLLGSRRRQFIAFGIIAVALGILVYQGLGNATVYFKTADEAVAQRAKLASHRFRLEQLEERMETEGLEHALAARRAEGAVTAPPGTAGTVGADRTAPAVEGTPIGATPVGAAPGEVGRK